MTLGDVAILLVFRIHDIPVARPTNSNIIALHNMCEALLGGWPGGNDVCRGEIKLLWLTQYVGLLPVVFYDAIAWHVHGYILSLLGHCIMLNKSIFVVHGKFLQLLVNLDQIGLYS